MKVGIISVNNAHNFGSSMQAYALLTYLRSQGHTAQVINYRRPAIENSYLIQNKPKKGLKSHLKYYVLYTKKALKKPYLLLRRKRFEKFFDMYFEQTAPVSTYKQLCNANYDFDAAFAGSDQIWNPNIIKLIDPAFFLKFLEGKTICASYAASLGITELSEAQEKVFSEYLKHLDYISVREQSAQQLLQPLSDEEIEVISDPTVLLEPEEYEKLLQKRPYAGDYIYVHVHHFTAKSPKLIELAKEVSEKTGLPIIHNFQNYTFPNQAGRTRDAGPLETLTAIYYAKIVLTQSFHATVFSLFFHKQFLTLQRDQYNTRLSNLLGAVGMEDHLVIPDTTLEQDSLTDDFVEQGMSPDLSSLSDDFGVVDSYFIEERKIARQFIEKVLTGCKRKPVLSYLKSCDPFTCYGCSACSDLCPHHAIEMKTDEEGFVRPVIDPEKCIHCGICERGCIWGKGERTPKMDREGYLAFAADQDTQVNSSSGGVATVLGKYFIEQGGFVVGVRWETCGTAIYDLTDTAEGLEAFKYSKYTEPAHGDIYHKTKKALETGRPVLFIGQPCKVAGLNAFLHKSYNNLYTAELVCECSPSPLILPIHLRKIAGKAKKPVTSIRFREPGDWEGRITSYTYEDGTVEKVRPKKELYYQCFIKRYLAKPSCYRCEFIRYKTESDIVMGDFWGVEGLYPGENFSKGVSCVIVNTNKGKELMEATQNRFMLRPAPAQYILDHNASWPSEYNVQRATLVRDIIRAPERAEILMHHARYPSKKKKG